MYFKSSKSKHGEKRHVFVFSDLIVLTTKKGSNKYDHKLSVSLDDAKLITHSHAESKSRLSSFFSAVPPLSDPIRLERYKIRFRVKSRKAQLYIESGNRRPSARLGQQNQKINQRLSETQTRRPKARAKESLRKVTKWASSRPLSPV